MHLSGSSWGYWYCACLCTGVIEDAEVSFTIRQQLRVLACYRGVIHDFWVQIIAQRVHIESSFERCYRYHSLVYFYFRIYEEKKKTWTWAVHRKTTGTVYVGSLGCCSACSTYRAQTISLSFWQQLRICAWDWCSTRSNTSIKESDARRAGFSARRLRKESSVFFVSTGVSGREWVTYL